MSKIAIFVPSLDGGGAERVMATLANSFAARRYSVDLVLASATGHFLEAVSDDVRVVDLRADRVIKALLPLASYLRNERPLVMLSAMGHANVISLLARKLTRVHVPIVVSERGLISGEREMAKSVTSLLCFWLIPIVYPWADAICAVSKAAAHDLARFISLPLCRVQTIYNPFDLKLITARSLESFEHPWFSTGQPPVILAVGRLNEAKDFSMLLRAFAKLREHRLARLVILGEGQMRSKLEALVVRLGFDNDTVQLPGFVPNPYPWMAKCSLFTLSSRREGLPGVLVEAMACGAPIVSTDCLSGPSEILEGGLWGRLVPVGDVEALAHAMAETLDMSSKDRPNVRRRAADFDLDRAVDAYLRTLCLPLQANITGGFPEH